MDGQVQGEAWMPEALLSSGSEEQPPGRWAGMPECRPSQGWREGDRRRQRTRRVGVSRKDAGQGRPNVARAKDGGSATSGERRPDPPSLNEAHLVT
ncbi:MAG: hypothetical protein EA428_14155 [Spirochaetaceae bacterium]|nr:MAG: hypothetical protein EA428_14155 [Spirochaetaceae bacterium]